MPINDNTIIVCLVEMFAEVFQVLVNILVFIENSVVRSSDHKVTIIRVVFEDIIFIIQDIVVIIQSYFFRFHAFNNNKLIVVI